MQKEQTLEQEKMRTGSGATGNYTRETNPDGVNASEANTNETSISVNVLWFSVLADHRGRRTEQLSLPDGTRGSDLIDLLANEMPIIATYRDYIRLAVNQVYVDGSKPLHHGDEVALITPVSGG